MPRLKPTTKRKPPTGSRAKLLASSAAIRPAVELPLSIAELVAMSGVS